VVSGRLGVDCGFGSSLGFDSFSLLLAVSRAKREPGTAPRSGAPKSTISKKEGLDMLTWIAILLAGSSCLNADTLNFHNGATLHGSFVGADNRTVRFAIGDQVKSLPAGRCRFDSVQRGSCSGIGHTGTRFRAGSLQLRVRPRPAAGRDTNHDPDDRQRGFPPGPARPALPGQHRSTGGGEWTSYRSARSRCSGGAHRQTAIRTDRRAGRSDIGFAVRDDRWAGS
jgi:hypothetical protein